MSFWTAEDKIPIGQTKISIPAEHGLNYNPGQKIEFHIPSSVNFFQPKESYLKFDVQLSNPDVASDPLALQLDGQMGGQVLIRDLRIYSGGAGRVLLEEFQNYNVLTALKYDYEVNDTIKAKRALTEGCVFYNEQQRSTTGLVQDTANNLSDNPYFDQPGLVRTTAGTDCQPKKAKCLLPLNTGIFSNDKIFPVGLTDGLIVEIILESAKMSIRQLDTVSKARKLRGNPVFLSANGLVGGAAPPVDPNAVPQYPEEDDIITSFWIRRDNMMGISAGVGAKQIPFVVGQKFVFMNLNTMVENVNSTAGAGGVATIEALEYVAGGTKEAVKVTCSTYTVSADMSVNSIMIDKSVDASPATFAPTYKISDCEFIVQQVSMPQGYTSKLGSMMKEGGAMNYDFLSFTNYKTSQIASEKLTTLRVPLVQTRAKAVLAIPVDATIYTTKQHIKGDTTEIEYFDSGGGSAPAAAGGKSQTQNASVRSGLVGITDEITQYQLFYDGKLNPSRAVSTARISGKVSVDQQPIIELEKALVMAGIRPHSLMNFQKNFCLGRALSLQDGVYDARGRDFQFQVEYSGATEPTKNKLWNVWCAHLRRIVISGNSISLQV